MSLSVLANFYSIDYARSNRLGREWRQARHCIIIVSSVEGVTQTGQSMGRESVTLRAQNGAIQVTLTQYTS